MDAMPVICPHCGELVIVLPSPDGRTLIVPQHLDRVMPLLSCPASNHALTSTTSHLR